MKTELTALLASDKLKLIIALLAIGFLAVDAWESKSVGSLAWTILVIYWMLPEKPIVETKL